MCIEEMCPYPLQQHRSNEHRTSTVHPKPKRERERRRMTEKFFCSAAIFTIFVITNIVNISILEGKHVDRDHYKDAGGEHDANYDHEMFLGKKEAEEFNELTPELSKQRLSLLIPKMDANNDGLLEENELKDHIRLMQKKYVENNVDQTWTNYGEEKIKDGVLSYANYREIVYGIMNENENDLTEEYQKMLKRDKRRWDEANLDRNDGLDRIEYACFMHPEDCEHMRDIVVQETVEDIDKDKDGFVDMSEYIGDMYRPDDYPELVGKEPEWVASERDLFKEHRDKDGDGKLNSEEMRDWVMPIGFDHAEAEARHLIGVADDNHDGKLSTEEILGHYDTFVGSQATNYGEQLQKHDPSEF